MTASVLICWCWKHCWRRTSIYWPKKRSAVDESYVQRQIFLIILLIFECSQTICCQCFVNIDFGHILAIIIFFNVCLNDVALLWAPTCRPGRRTVCHFLALSELRCGHPGRNLPLYCGPKTTPAHPQSNSLQNHFATPCSSLSLRLGLLFDRSHDFTSNQPWVKVGQISASLKFSFT